MSDKPDNTDVPLLEKYSGLVWKVARAFTHNDADLEDLVQEINISLWCARDANSTGGKESTFFYRVALNRAISWQRKQANYLKHLQAFFLSRPKAAQTEPTDEADQDLALLYQAIRQIPELDRAAILMHLDRCTYAQIAEVLGVSEVAAGKRLSRAKQKLSKLINSREQNV